MHCSNCGKDIPFNGNVCPYCHADKSKDKEIHMTFLAGAFAGGLIGWKVAGEDFIGAMIGGFIGGIVLGTIAIVVTLFQKKK